MAKQTVQHLYNLLGSVAAEINNRDDFYLATGLNIVDSLEHLVVQYPRIKETEIHSIYNGLESLKHEAINKDGNQIIMKYHQRLRPIFTDTNNSSSTEPHGSPLLHQALKSMSTMHGSHNENIISRVSTLIERVNHKPPQTMDQDHDYVKQYFAGAEL